MAYRAPVSEMVFMMNAAAGLQEGIADGVYADLADGMAEATLNEAAKYAENVLGPLHRVGDQVGCKWADGVVTTPPGWVEAYAQFVEGGWQSVTGSPDPLVLWIVPNQSSEMLPTAPQPPSPVSSRIAEASSRHRSTVASGPPLG